MQSLWMILTAVAALTTGLMAGVYFSFSTFVMQALRSLPVGQGAQAMIAINRVILSSLFMPLFVVSTLLCVALIGTMFLNFSWLNLVAGMSYLLGMFVVTAIKNVPLNNRLKEAAGRNQEVVWQEYLTQWGRWNHVRTLFSTLASLLYLLHLSGF